MATPTESAPHQNTATEHEPLLGRPGDVSQADQDPLPKNVLTGTAPIAQLGVFLLFGTVWGAVLTHNLILFSAHPLLNSFGILVVAQAILILQPTHTPQQKQQGTIVHATFLGIALLAFYAGLGLVEWHKKRNGIGHFESPHAVLGVVIYILMLIQAIFGVAQYFLPVLFGGVGNAKAMYKYHRVSGYLILFMMLLNVILATSTYYAGVVLGIKMWATILATVFIVIGIVPRIKKQKLPFLQ